MCCKDAIVVSEYSESKGNLFTKNLSLFMEILTRFSVKLMSVLLFNLMQVCTKPSFLVTKGKQERLSPVVPQT